MITLIFGLPHKGNTPDTYGYEMLELEFDTSNLDFPSVQVTVINRDKVGSAKEWESFLLYLCTSHQDMASSFSTSKSYIEDIAMRMKGLLNERRIHVVAESFANSDQININFSIRTDEKLKNIQDLFLAGTLFK